jgi:hypothetical protein
LFSFVQLLLLLARSHAVKILLLGDSVASGLRVLAYFDGEGEAANCAGAGLAAGALASSPANIDAAKATTAIRRNFCVAEKFIVTGPPMRIGIALHGRAGL